jgi:hypothetical protein
MTSPCSGPAPGRAQATCNKAKPVPISDSQLVEARYINTTIEAFPSKKTTLAPQPQSVFHYFVQTGEGSVRFSDNSKNQPVVLRSLALLVLQIAQQDCHLSQ